ncbi:MAG: hypothetical protein IT330_19395 [Anaerolineae bacterium]|nr:hypothetical protein [Anaerolineae bacterium]
MKRYGWVVVVLACVVALTMAIVAVSASREARVAQGRLLAFQQRPPIESESDTGSELPSTLGPAQRLYDLEGAMQKACPVSTTHRIYAYAGFLVAIVDLRSSPGDDDLARCLTLLARANEGGKGIAILKVEPAYLILPDGHPGRVLWQLHYILVGPAGIQWLTLAERTDGEVVDEANHSIWAFIDPELAGPFTGLWWSEVFSVFGAAGALPRESLRDAPVGNGDRSWDW